MKKFFGLIFVIFILSSIFTSCKNKTAAKPLEDGIQLVITDSTLPSSEIAQKPISRSYSKKNIVVLLGYGFNTDEAKEKFIPELEDRYGFSENGGLIFPLCFPDDFKRTGRSYATEFFNEISSPELNIGGIVLLGAPEYSHLALARNQDAWDEKVPYPVISLFPQDDNLGIESTSDFIIDRTLATDLNGEPENEEEHLSVSDEYFNLVFRIIDYIKMGDFEITDFSDSLLHVKQILKDQKFHNFTDSETGLKSINHFVLNYD